MNNIHTERIFQALDGLDIELPSWGFADTGTRFGKFHQDAAAIDIYDKIKDAATVHRLTGACSAMAVHVLWDFNEEQAPETVTRAATFEGIRIGSINPNLFQDQAYKLGSFGNPDTGIQNQALQHCLDSIGIATRCDSRIITLWFADGTNYPGQDDIRRRKRVFEQHLQRCHESLSEDQTLLIEYKPFEPAFYHTDIADWGMSLQLAQKTGSQAKVLVDTGHHYASQNIEQIVAWLLDEGRLGGFHFNDRRYADDDLTLGSIDPYQVFRIFAEIHGYKHDSGSTPEIAYMVDQSHNLKPKIQAMIQTVTWAQELYAKAALVDFNKLRQYQSTGDIIEAEQCLQRAFMTDVTGAIKDWRNQHKLPENPLQSYRESGHEQTIAKERKERRAQLGLSSASSYA
jgi:L-rhamnose isomerase/sugar isomerase